MHASNLPSPDNFHVFQQDDTWYLFLTIPVAVFNIDEQTALVLRRYEANQSPRDENEQNRLASAGRFIGKYTSRTHGVRSLRTQEDITDKVAGLYLFVCQDCNLRCSYCYGNEGEYGNRCDMSEETLQQTFDAFYAKRDGKHFLTFFGGEPLMNFPIMRRTAELCQENLQNGGADISLGIVTNGTIYNEQIRSFFREHIDNVTFSLDGPQEINDGQRISKSGHSVYQTAEKNIRKLTEAGRFNWAFRSIVTSRSYNRVAEIFDHLDTFGSGGIGLVDVDLPVEHPLHVNDDQYQQFLKQIIEVNHKGLQSFLDGDQAVAFEYPFYILFYLVSRCHTLYHCNAGSNLLAVTAEGDVYPCHRFVGESEFCMGNVSDPQLRERPRFRELRQKFIDLTVDARPECSRCWARYLCGGACVKHAWSEQGDLAASVERHCLYIKTVVEALLPELAKVMGDPIRRERLKSHLARAITQRYGTTTWTESDHAQPSKDHSR
jgi:uncharacterized protein